MSCSVSVDFYVKEKMAAFNAWLTEQRSVRLEERRKKRIEERKATYYRKKEEELRERKEAAERASKSTT
jgi:hypothetical protein